MASEPPKPDPAASLPALGELLGHAGDGIILTDADANIRWLSGGVERLFGYSRVELLGRNVHVLLPSGVRRAHASWVRHFRDGELASRAMAGSRVVFGRHRSGRDVPVEATIARLEGGRTLGVILHEVGDRQATEGTLPERLSRARELADALPVLTSFVDRDLRQRFVNRAYANWFVRARHEIEGGHIRSVMGDAMFARAEPRFRAALAGERSRFRARLRKGDGEVAEVDVLLVPAVEKDGGVDGFFLVGVAVPRSERSDSLRKMMTEAGRLLSDTVDPELSLLSAVHLAADGFAERVEAFLREPDGSFRSVQSLGPDQPASESMSPAEHLPESVRQSLADGVARVHSRGNDQWVFLTQAIPGRKEPRGAIRFGWAPPYDPGPREIEVAEDLAKRMGSAFEHAQVARLAREAVLQRDWIMERVLHDLSGPTASIWMVADRMLRSAPDPDRRTRSHAHVEAIAGQAKELERLITDLRAATDLRAGYALVESTPVDVRELIEDVGSVLAPILEWHGLDLRITGPNVREVWALADPYHLRRLLSALVMNTVRDADRGSSVEVRAVHGARDVRFEVIGAARIGNEGEDPEAVSGDDPTSEQGAPTPALDLVIAEEMAEAQGTTLSFGEGASEGRVSFSVPTTG